MKPEIQPLRVRGSAHKLSGNVVVQKVRAITAEIEEIQNDLYTHFAEPDGSRKSHLLGSELSSGEDVSRLRTAVDQLRRVLWFYAGDDASITALERTHVPAVGDLREQRLEGRSVPGPDAPWERSTSFFERLNLVIDGYMQPSGTVKKTPKF